MIQGKTVISTKGDRSRAGKLPGGGSYSATRVPKVKSSVTSKPSLFGGTTVNRIKQTSGEKFSVTRQKGSNFATIQRRSAFRAPTATPAASSATPGATKQNHGTAMPKVGWSTKSRAPRIKISAQAPKAAPSAPMVKATSAPATGRVPNPNTTGGRTNPSTRSGSGKLRAATAKPTVAKTMTKANVSATTKVPKPKVSVKI